MRPRRASAHLTESVRTLWPEPTELSVRHGGGRREGKRTFLVLPSLQRPVLLLPVESAAAAVVLRRQNGPQGTLTRHALALAAALQERQILHRLPLPRLVVDSPDAAAAVESVLVQVLGDVGHVIVRLGRRRFNRAVVLWILDHEGETIAFVKLASSGSGRDALEQEYAALATVSEKDIPGLRVPRPLAYLRWSDSDLLVLSPLIWELSRVEPSVPVAQMRALAGAWGHRDVALAGSPATRRLADGIASLGDLPEARWLSVALERVLSDFGDLVVPEGAWHGDWVSWNMGRDADGVLLWDWEHHDTAVLAGFDHVHHLAQRLRMRVGTGPDAEDRWLSEADEALRQVWGLDPRQREAVIRTYLVEVNLRFVRDRVDDPQGIGERPGWGQPLLERMALKSRWHEHEQK